jgi:UDP-N-acetylmuramyl-tripeptide synthetase
MKLKELLNNITTLKSQIHGDVEIMSITMHHDEVMPNSLFFAIRGGNNDGNNYINDAIACGAVAVVTAVEPAEDVPYVLVSDVREAMALIAGNFYLNRHKDIKTIALVGTNGKTTTSHIIGEILKADNKKVAVVGTLGAFINGQKEEIDLTTPDPIELHRLIALSYDQGVTHFVFEASEHAIYLKKLAGIKVDVCVFSNFSQDHLDFFKTMENYKAATQSFFQPQNLEFAVLNVDDELGRDIIKQGNLFYTTYGLLNPADNFALNVELGNGIKCLVNSCDEIFEIETSLCGMFNVYNLLAAASCCRVLGVRAESVITALKRMQPVSGRFNILASTKRVVIDYAHTPVGLENLLKAARDICNGKIICVFGCGGDRDASKRPLMGEMAAKYADFSILTQDNSRHENTDDIILQIEQGCKQINNKYIKISERENAITYALLLAKTDDLVVIAGKGGEEYIEENGIKRPYSDTKVVMDIFERYSL